MFRTPAEETALLIKLSPNLLTEKDWRKQPPLLACGAVKLRQLRFAGCKPDGLPSTLARTLLCRLSRPASPATGGTAGCHLPSPTTPPSPRGSTPVPSHGGTARRRTTARFGFGWPHTRRSLCGHGSTYMFELWVVHEARGGECE